MGIQRFGPQPRQFDLPDRSCRLRIGEAAAAAMRQAEFRCTQRDRPGGYENNLRRLPQRGDFRRQRGKPCAARSPLFHQQGRTDLNNKAIGARQVG